MQLEGSSVEVRCTLPSGELVLSDGRVIKPKAVEVTASPATVGKEIESARAAQATLERVHRKLGDLPASPEKMNAIAAILVYESVGLSVDDIAVALRTSTENINRVRDLEAYRQLREMFDTAVFEDTKRAANHIIARGAGAAAKKIVSLVESEDENVSLTAARDVAKFAGVGMDKVNDAKVTGLNITIRRKGDKDDDNITVEINNG